MTAPNQRPDVAIATYQYRHEAEFAAGFLADAGIPFRLQIDDAGGADAGMTVSNPARLWIRAADVDAARAILDFDEPMGSPLEDPSDDPEMDPPRGTFIPPPTAPERSAPYSPLADRLCLAERVAAAALAILCSAGALGVDSLTGVGLMPLWSAALFGLAAIFTLAALLGRTWGPFRSILRSLSGLAP